MSGSLNKVILIGNLGRDPELKMTPNGQALARFSIATTETWRNPAGEKQSKTEWHNIVVWGKQAEIAEKYLRKGKQVLVEGRIQYREYTDQAGVKKTACDIRCDNFVMLGKMDEGGANRGSSRDEGYDDPMPPAPAANSGANYDDDIPF
ncbi:MAG: single-stranded DNA-binding protein [Firmicutes bacterium]|nr:single-stranded DNA-binding protein [Bacillota bacterium]